MIGRQLRHLFSRRDWRGDASAYLDDELTPRRRKQFEARLAGSNEMQEYLDDLRQMRTALRGFAAESARAPFQITPEMLASHTAAPLRAGNVERALRLSMTTAAVGVAAFTAVLIFDAVDRPSVTFTTTSAGDVRAGVPAAQVAVERAAAQESADDAGESAVAVVSIASSESQQAQQAAVQAAVTEQAAAQAEQATVSAHDAEQDSQAWQEQAVQEQEQALAQAEEQQQAVQESEWQQSAQEQAESAQAAAHEQAAADPSRRALNAGSATGEANEQEVSAADVVATQEEQSAEAAVAAAPAQEDEEPPASDSADAAEGQESAESTVTGESAESDESSAGAGEPAGGQAAADAATASPTATVTSTVRVVESEWPLPQRSQSSSVRLATDPSWEAPLQIALAVVAFGSLLAWVVLTVMDRRRQT